LLGSKQALFAGLSFETVSASGPNGAIIHYSPDPKNSATIDPNNVRIVGLTVERQLT
jgi:Xaa-Pro aminopeptidase